MPSCRMPFNTLFLRTQARIFAFQRLIKEKTRAFPSLTIIAPAAMLADMPTASAQNSARSARRAIPLAPLLLALALASMAGACFLGPVPIPAESVLNVLLRLPARLFSPQAGAAQVGSDALIVQIRLSRIILAFGVGAALALAGAALQGVLRNPLADPFTLGISGGAAFGASLALSLGISALLLPWFALGGAALALAAVLGLAVRGGLGRDSLILAGVVISAFLAALIALVKALNEDSVSGIVFWIMGSLQNRTWTDVELFLPLFLIGAGPLLLLHRQLDLLALGERQARLLGMHAARMRLILLIAASCLSAAAVSVAGIIGFVGIIVPHLIRLFRGASHKGLLPNSALAGGILLLWSDTLARMALNGGMELPVGVVTALLGGPFFCFILGRRIRNLYLQH